MTTEHPAIAAPPVKKTPFEYQDSGSFGMDRALWSQIRAVYARFGGTTERSTTKEQNTLYRMPGGVQLQGGRASEVNKKIGQQGLRQIMQGVRRAGIPPILFLAAMAEHGVAFVTKSPDVTKAQRWLKETNPDLSSVESWKKASTDLLAWIRGQGEKVVETKGGSEPERIFPYTIREAIELAGLEDKKDIQKYSARIASQVKGGYNLGKKLIEKGHIHQDKSGKGNRTYYHVDEPGALMIARFVEESHGPGKGLPEPTETVDQQLDLRVAKKAEIPRPRMTLDSAFISAAIIDYFKRRDMHPNAEVVFRGVSDDRFSAEVEFKFGSESESDG